jgi:ABC-type branched-subunit amino acid transport system ATPase component
MRPVRCCARRHRPHLQNVALFKGMTTLDNIMTGAR